MREWPPIIGRPANAFSARRGGGIAIDRMLTCCWRPENRFMQVMLAERPTHIAIGKIANVLRQSAFDPGKNLRRLYGFRHIQTA